MCLPKESVGNTWVGRALNGVWVGSCQTDKDGEKRNSYSLLTRCLVLITAYQRETLPGKAGKMTAYLYN